MHTPFRALAAHALLAGALAASPFHTPGFDDLGTAGGATGSAVAAPEGAATAAAFELDGFTLEPRGEVLVLGPGDGERLRELLRELGARQREEDAAKEALDAAVAAVAASETRIRELEAATRDLEGKVARAEDRVARIPREVATWAEKKGAAEKDKERWTAQYYIRQDAFRRAEVAARTANDRRELLHREVKDLERKVRRAPEGSEERARYADELATARAQKADAEQALEAAKANLAANRRSYDEARVPFERARNTIVAADRALADLNQEAARIPLQIRDWKQELATAATARREAEGTRDAARGAEAEARDAHGAAIRARQAVEERLASLHAKILAEAQDLAAGHADFVRILGGVSDFAWNTTPRPGEPYLESVDVRVAGETRTMTLPELERAIRDDFADRAGELAAAVEAAKDAVTRGEHALEDLRKKETELGTRRAAAAEKLAEARPILEKLEHTLTLPRKQANQSLKAFARLPLVQEMMRRRFGAGKTLKKKQGKKMVNDAFRPYVAGLEDELAGLEREAEATRKRIRSQEETNRKLGEAVEAATREVEDFERYRADVRAADKPGMLEVVRGIRGLLQ